jgi:aerobic-type carbon monoxide dehydrogenase small subunit (CoxS/CutS family)
MRLRVNGTEYDIDAPAHATLLAVLRDRLELTGTKLVCDRGECGACTVLLDDGDGPAEPAYSCLTLAAACEGRGITTIEGLAAPGELHALQRAFIAHDALQCGFCTPGQILAALALLRECSDPTEEEVVRGMSGNLCRCGAYRGITEAVLEAQKVLDAASRKEVA